jgi:hypothetical protein
MGNASGFGSLGVMSPASAASGPPSPPFASTSAVNGLSVDPTSGKIVLGNDLGGVTAVLLSNREIPTGGFNTFFTGVGNVVIGTNLNAGQRLQIAQSLTGAQTTGAVGITATWNTAGVPTLIAAVVTNTASGLGSLLMDIRTTAGVRFRNFSDGHVQWGDPVATQAMTWSPISIAAGGGSGSGGQSTSFQILARYGQNNGTTQLNSISINDFITASGGTSPLVGINLQQTYNMPAGFTGLVRGIYFNPQVLQTPATGIVAWENVVGDMNFGTTSGNVNSGPVASPTAFINNANHAVLLGDVSAVANKTFFQLDDAGTKSVMIYATGGLTIRDVTGTAHGNIAYNAGASGLAILNSAVGGVTIGNAVEGDIFAIAAGGQTSMNGGGGNNYFAGDGTTAAILVQLGDLGAKHNSTTLKVVDARKSVNILTMQTFASNALALAGGLIVGDLYKNAAGVVSIVF